MKISDIDSNFKKKSSVGEKNIAFFNAAEKPFSVHGLLIPDKEENYYRRMPNSVAKLVNSGVGGNGKEHRRWQNSFQNRFFLNIFYELRGKNVKST